jgi:cytidylate kinase
VRIRLVELQRKGAAEFGAVVEGRDIGTVVFPDTPFKFFLTADPAERARRRVLQLEEAGKQVDPKAIEEEIADRDHRDSQREASPLSADDSYTVVDSTGLTKEEVISLIVSSVKARSEFP